MRIAVDMDDTVVDFFPHLLRCVNREYGTDLRMEDVTEWDDIPLKRMRIFANGGTWWDWLQSRDWLWTKAPAIEGAIGGLRQLRDMGHQVELLTSKPEWAEWVVWAWLGKWRPSVLSVTIVEHGAVKADICSARLLIDDGPHNVEPWVDSGRPAIMFDKPWNQLVASTDTGRRWGNVTLRAYDWADVVRFVKEMG